jgi:cellulose synthase/poly-beta-1,6-N-acetylglucosamine synthase-like glycosyltransferase
MSVAVERNSGEHAAELAVGRAESGLPKLEGTVHELSVVIPTCNEAESIGLLLEALSRALVGIDAEVIFVDDSSDSTPAAIEAHARESALSARVAAVWAARCRSDSRRRARDSLR